LWPLSKQQQRRRWIKEEQKPPNCLSVGNLIAIDKELIKGSKFVKGETSGAKEQSSNFSPSEILFILDITLEQWNHRMEIKVQELTGKNVSLELKDKH
jgi:hypothetical protein